MCKLEELVDQFTSDHEAMMGDFLSDCNVLKEELQVS